MHCPYAMSYRLWRLWALAAPWLDPMAVPPTSPVAPPIAAPAPTLPVAAPTAAPRPAPTTVPSTAPLRALLLAVSLGDVPPICCWAHCLQTASSVWNTSKGFPGPGSTAILGPVGTDAHPTRPASTKHIGTTRLQFIVLRLLFRPGRSRPWYGRSRQARRKPQSILHLRLSRQPAICRRLLLKIYACRANVSTIFCPCHGSSAFPEPSGWCGGDNVLRPAAHPVPSQPEAKGVPRMRPGDGPPPCRSFSRLKALRAVLPSRGKWTSRSLLRRGTDKNVDRAGKLLDITVPIHTARPLALPA
jgi:hypothetical protein